MKKLALVLTVMLFVFNAKAQKVEIVPGTTAASVGDLITVSVVITGFDSETTSLGAIEFYIDFNHEVLSYTGVENFSELLPENEWFFSSPGPTLDRFSCNWAQPMLQNVGIQDGTTLFDLKFLCLAGESTLTFDSAASLFIHIDGLNYVSLPVEYTNGLVQVTVNINQADNSAKYISSIDGNKVVISNIEGTIRITDLIGREIKNCVVSGTGTHYISIEKHGFFIVSLVNKQTRISRKIFID